MRGAIRPVWSPDGRRVAFEVWAQTWQGDKQTQVREVWVVDRDGKNLRRTLEGSKTGARWSPDGKALTIEKSTKWPGGRIEVDDLPSRGPEAFPQPPAKVLAALRAKAEAKVRVGTFDVAPILAANRAWQNPSLDHLHSVQFVHKMEPIRLDERFAWRRDGAMLLDVVHFGREKPEEHVGSAWVTTPGGPIHSFAPRSRYPNVEAKTAQEINVYALDHLMGTRTSFIALNWGRNPSAFEIRDVRRDDDGKTVKLELAPRPTRSAGASGSTRGRCSRPRLGLTFMTCTSGSPSSPSRTLLIASSARSTTDTKAKRIARSTWANGSTSAKADQSPSTCDSGSPVSNSQ